MVLYQCVAKHLCGMTRTPITNPQHHCMQCRGPFHSAVLCGVLWSERDRSTILIRKVDCSRHAQSLWVSATAAMCFACVEKLDSGLPTEQLGAVSPICLVALPLELDTPTVLSSPGVGPKDILERTISQWQRCGLIKQLCCFVLLQCILPSSLTGSVRGTFEVRRRQAF